MRKRKKMVLVAHYAIVDGEKIEIDPHKTNLPDRCKLALAEMVTGQKFELLKLADS